MRPRASLDRIDHAQPLWTPCHDEGFVQHFSARSGPFIQSEPILHIKARKTLTARQDTAYNTIDRRIGFSVPSFISTALALLGTGG
jgi:hypothetical protein